MLSAADARRLSQSIPILVDDAGSVIHKSSFIRLSTYTVVRCSQFRFSAGFFMMEIFIRAPSIAYGTRSAASVIGPFHEGLLQFQDLDDWIRAACLGYSVHISDRVAGQISNSRQAAIQ